MSNAIVVPASFNGQVASVFQGQAAGDDLSGGITGGYGLLKYRGKVWSIQHNGNSLNLMRDDGDGPRGSVDIVILKANAQLSKTWYEAGWDENNNNPPDCASANGIVPDAGVPKPQSTVCAMCPKNAWGSSTGGSGKGKACGDHRRLAVVPLTDLRNETFGGPLLLRCPAASLQDMAAFDSRYKGMGYPYFTMGLKIGFDPAESFPKFTFSAIRPLDEAEGKIVMEMRNSPETARVINEGTAPAQAAIAPPAAGAFLEPVPATTMVQAVAQPAAVAPPVSPQPVAAAPVAVAAQPAAVAAAAAPAQQPVAQPVAAGPTPAHAGQPAVSAGGFGAAAPTAAPVSNPAPAVAVTGAAPEPAPVAEAPVRAATQMTGFGNVTPEVTAAPVAAPAAAPVAPVPAAAAPVIPGVVTAFEGSIDERLSALLA